MMNGSQAPEHAALEVAGGHCHNSRASGAELPAVSQALPSTLSEMVSRQELSLHSQARQQLQN